MNRYIQIAIPALVLCGVLFSGCQNQSLRAREAGALGGAALGAGLGAIIGNQTGNAGEGVAIGSAIGALSGALMGNEVDKADDDLNQRDQRIAAQERQLAENRRLIEELRKRGADVRSTDRGVVVNLPDVLFEFDKARVTPSARRTIEEIATVIGSADERRIYVEGHTDSIGTISYNQDLSERRALSVADELVRNGISRRRVTTRGFGESDPIASNSTDVGRQRNRRVEVIISNR